ncbi:hypothetical protein ONE63_010101 [Megalurothrips usitatus]|uniref:[acyl-carrier-protein] S-malonyltransferase n=1 Tax=Megalurothrips usitatus TaxID=439358 RepID=A0AAV7XNP8_9NEOP|nr:hypothetical protein ONE63_010101 [Megalurothrips usitatus]
MMAARHSLRTYCLSVRSRQFHVSSASSRRGKPDETHRISEDHVRDLLKSATVGDKQKVGDQKWLESPYSGKNVRDQALKSLRPKIDPRETSIILFPGQGVQYVGMGKSLLKIPEVKEMYKTANEILGYDLLKMCLNGPQSDLDLTVHCQPAIYVASLAALQLMIEERQVSIESCVATAGFSLGEYASLVLSNCLTFEEGLRLVKKRAEAMNSAAEKVQGGLLTVFLDPAAKTGTILNSALEWCLKTGVENPVCSVANYLYPHCRVIGGNIEALQFIEQNCADLSIRKCKRIPVSGAFHTDLMKPAAEEFAEVLRQANMRQPEIAVHSNLDGLIYSNVKDIKKKLVRQIYRPVKWEQTLHILYDRGEAVGFPQTFEVGPGRSLLTLLRYANRPASKDAVNFFA